MRFQKYIILGAVLSLVGCSATTSLQSKNANVTLQMNHTSVSFAETPVQKTYKTTSLGQYKFRALKDGTAPMYGLVPLKFNNGYLVADLLFFTPAMLYNLREVFPFYEFDVAAGVVRYKKKADDQWTEYKPTPEEASRAQEFFTQLDANIAEEQAKKAEKAKKAADKASQQ